MKKIGMPKVVSLHSGLQPLDGAMMSNDSVKWHD
jgi:hypothetical protein